MRLIDADELKIDYGFSWDDITPTHEEMIAVIERQPTIDAVPVARCKDCKHYKKSEVSDRMMCWRKDVDGQPVCYDFNPDDFCSYGEPMDIRETLDRIAPESEAVDLSDLSTYAQGYLDAESKYRRMIEDGELVEVVRCKDCRFFVDHRCRAVKSISDWRGMYDYCSMGEARIDPDVRAKRDSLGVV